MGRAVRLESISTLTFTRSLRGVSNHTSPVVQLCRQEHLVREPASILVEQQYGRVETLIRESEK